MKTKIVRLGMGETPGATRITRKDFLKIGGTGLGMVFVRQIVDEHRGVINLDSKVGRGTTVTIRLPLRFVEAPGVSGPEAPPEAPPWASGGRRE